MSQRSRMAPVMVMAAVGMMAALRFLSNATPPEAPRVESHDASADVVEEAAPHARLEWRIGEMEHVSGQCTRHLVRAGRRISGARRLRRLDAPFRGARERHVVPNGSTESSTMQSGRRRKRCE